MISRSVEYFRQSWNTWVRSSIAFYRVGMHSTGLEYFRQRWNTFVQGWNAFYRVGMLSTELEFRCIELE
jgi:hypothetical protein